jgi:ArsR family transcriptional regulator, nickel/cobalt-responsive transcriptional repressor
MPRSNVHAAHQAGSLPGPAVLEAITETMSAFATGSRVSLLFAIAGRERTVGELAGVIETTSAAVSQQLRILRNLKLVAARREGKSVYYRLYDDHVEALLEEIRHHAEHALRGWAMPGKTSERKAIR